MKPTHRKKAERNRSNAAIRKVGVERKQYYDLCAELLALLSTGKRQSFKAKHPKIFGSTNAPMMETNAPMRGRSKTRIKKV